MKTNGFPQASEATRRLNPHLFGNNSEGDKKPTLRAKQVRRLRQEQGPKLNKLETEWLAELQRRLGPAVNIHCQAWRVNIANGAWFKVDMCAVVGTHWNAWECKGPEKGKNVARGKLALKCAAAAFPEVLWHLAWKDEFGYWQEQVVLP